MYTFVQPQPKTLSIIGWLGAIGGVAGEDVTVINTPPHRHLNIWGIYNHEFTSVPINTIVDLDH